MPKRARTVYEYATKVPKYKASKPTTSPGNKKGRHPASFFDHKLYVNTVAVECSPDYSE